MNEAYENLGSMRQNVEAKADESAFCDLPLVSSPLEVRRYREKGIAGNATSSFGGVSTLFHTVGQEKPFYCEYAGSIKFAHLRHHGRLH